MHREAWRRWVRTISRREWNGGESGWSRRRHEVVEEQQQQLTQSLESATGFDSRGSRQGLRWTARGGTTAPDWPNAFFVPQHQGRTIGMMPAISVRYFAAPLSRTGKSLQNPARQQKADPDAPPEPEKPERRINRAIVSRTIRLITREGHLILTRAEALKHAENMDLDLVEVDSKQDPPVCKLLDFNKERFKDRQREKEHKKSRTGNVNVVVTCCFGGLQSERRRLDDLKEVRFSTRTEPKDLELKAQMALRLLTRGHRVKLAVIPHGNDDLEPKGRELLDRMMTLLQDSAKIETGPRIERQRAWSLIRPTAVGTRGSSTKTKEIMTTSKNADSDSEEEDEKAR